MLNILYKHVAQLKKNSHVIFKFGKYDMKHSTIYDSLN